jgi:hypothetical protein
MILSKKSVLSVSLFVLILWGVVLSTFANPPTSPYGVSQNIVDPACAPNSLNCYVASLSIGDTIGNSPDANGILYVDSSGDLTTDPLFTREDNNTYIAKEIETTAITNMDVVTGTLVYAADVVGAFQVGETITGGTSGATAVIDYIVSENSEDYLYLSNISGPFQALETVTGNTSFATGTYALAFPAGQFAVSDTFFAFNLDNQQVVGQGTITDITVDGYSVALSSGTISENDLIFDDLQNITKLDTIRSINATLGPGPTITTSIQSGDSIVSDLLPGGYQGTGMFYQDSTRLAGFYVGNDYFGNDFTFNQTALDLDANVGISIAAGYSDINGDPFYQIYYNDPNNSGFGFFGFSPTAVRLEHGEEIRLYAPQIRVGTGDGFGSGYYLPVSDGSNGQVLTTDGSGNVTWENGGGGGSLIGSTNTLGTESWLGYGVGGNNASSAGTVFNGYQAGYDATNAHYSIFQGYLAGTSATNADNSVFLGQYAGYQATDADYSNFFGQNAGYAATYAFNSNFFGVSAGAYASNAQQSNFFGANAGSNATDANYSNFFGQNAGSGATTAPNSNFFGTSAGSGATNATHSNFFGYYAGQGATDAVKSTFIGEYAGASATNAWSSVFVGDSAGRNSSEANRSNFFGSAAGWNATNAQLSNFFGGAAGMDATDAANSNFFGYSSGLSAISASNSNFFGNAAGYNATNASASNFFGLAAGQYATDASSSNFFGYQAGYSATSATNANFFGQSAGMNAVNASYSNFFGAFAGGSAMNASNSIFIGRQAGFSDSVDNTGNIDDFSILIGKSTSTGGYSNSIAIGGSATNTASNQFMIGSLTRPIDTLVLTGSGGNTCVLDVTVASPSCSSDETLKTNITDLSTETLDKLLKVKTVSYDWKNYPKKGSQIGFLAQDLEKYFPEVVSVAPNGFKTVSYGGMTPILVEALREMNLKVTNITMPADASSIVEKIVAKLVKADRVETKELCVDDVCVTRDQFLRILESSGQTPTATLPPSTDPDPTPSPDPLTCVDPQVLNEEGDTCIDPVTETPPAETPTPEPPPAEEPTAPTE